MLDEGVGWQGDSPLVPLREGSGPPVFLLHSTAGNVFEWHDLLACMDCDRPILAVQARGLDRETTPSVSVDEMAADYCNLIRARQPRGPYALMGYSFGGLLAFEIASRLARIGEKVEFLGLIDTDVQAGALPFVKQLSFRVKRLGHLIRRTTGLGVIRTFLRARDKTRQEIERVFDLNLPPILRQVRSACEQAFATYVPPSYLGEVTFFRSPDRRPYFCDPLVVWRHRAASLQVINVPGNHTTMMLEPNVTALAREIANCLPAYALSSAHQP